jgi:hypothetical protein|tara:strand:- start:1576 stop:2418 length:843 start_codon:yes stop_codon:yes gene_type:complete
MKSVNSLSGGKTSSYIAVNYPADYNVFALVRTNDKNCMFPDKKLRQVVSDRIGKEFIGTLEMDTIIYTMLDLEQMLGTKIDWVSGITFDEVVDTKGGWLPSMLRRFCTTEMKMKPIMEWWQKELNEVCEMRIGFRANEMRRANSLNKRLVNGVQRSKFVIGKLKDGRNKWGELDWRIPTYPLISKDKPIFKDDIENYWKDKTIRFAEINNCVGCFHRNPLLLNKMWKTHTNKMEWFETQEHKGKGTWKEEMNYEQIKDWELQVELSFDDFDECDSGYCGI